MAETIMFVGPTGGVGRTTMTMEVSYILSLKYRVLMIDLSNFCCLTTLNDPAYDEYIDSWSLNIYGCLARPFLVPAAIQTIHPKTEKHEGVLDFIRGSGRMFEEQRLLEKNITFLKELIAQIQEYKDYDYIMLDLCRDCGVIMDMAICASDYYVTVAELSSSSCKGIDRMYSEFEKKQGDSALFKARPLGIVFNRTLRSKTDYECRKNFVELSIKYGSHIFTTEIREKCLIKKSQCAGKAINEYCPTKIEAEEFVCLTKEMLNLMETDKCS